MSLFLDRRQAEGLARFIIEEHDRLGAGVSIMSAAHANAYVVAARNEARQPATYLYPKPEEGAK